MTPLSVLSYHCTVDAGLLAAAAVKVAVAPAVTVSLDGAIVIDGSNCTSSVAAVVVALPTEFVKTASYRLPLSAAVVAKFSVVEVSPLSAV